MPVGAIVGGSLASAGIGAGASLYASNQQSKASKNALNYQMGQATPYTSAGKGAIASLAELYGIDPNSGARAGDPFNQKSLDAFRNAPDYQFGMQEGLRGLQFGNAAKGLLKSGNNLRDTVQFGNDYASSKFGNYFQHLYQLAGLGANAGQGVASSMTGLGEAKASGTVGAANAATGAISSGMNNYMLYSLLNKNGGTNSTYGNAGTGSTFGNNNQPLFGDSFNIGQ